MTIRAGVVVLGLILAVAGVASPARSALAGGTPYCNDQLATVILDEGENYNGTSKANVVYGYGDNVINGNGGNDSICVEGTGSVVHGNSGNDYLATVNYGEADLYGDGGHDDIYLDDGDSRAWGGSGNDYIVARFSTLVDGGSGNDYISAYVVETVIGGSGNDEIHANSANSVDGGSGNDLVHSVDSLFADCGSGRDRYDFSGVEAFVNCEWEVSLG